MRDGEGITDFLAKARRITIGMVIASVGGLALGLVVLFLGDGRDDDGFGVHMILSCMTLMFFSVVVLGLLISAREPKYRMYALATGVVALVAFLCWMTIIWGDLWDELNRFTWTASMVTLAMTLDGSLRLLQTRFLVLRLAKLGVAVLLALDVVVISAMVWEVIPLEAPRGRGGPSWWFVAIVMPLTLLSLVGVIVVPLVIRLVEKRIIVTAESIPMKLTLQLTCAKCGAEQTASNGPARCSACGFRVMIEVEEPRCACGYLLFRLAGSVCPECGRPIPEDQKWLDAAEQTNAEGGESDGSSQPLRPSGGITTEPLEDTGDE